MATEKKRIMLAQKPAAELATQNPTLLPGEIVFESDTETPTAKKGPGAWNSLPYIFGSTINNNNFSGGNFAARSGYTSFANLLSTVGANKMTVLHDTDSTISSAVQIPATLQLIPTNGAKFNKSGSGTLEFQGIGLVGDTMQDLFSSFAAGEVKWTRSYPQFFRLEWFGGKANDSSFDNIPAFQKCVAAMAYADDWLQGGIVELSGGKYYFASTLEIPNNIIFRGQGKFTSVLVFPGNIVGLRIKGTSSPYRNPLSARLHDFGIVALSGGTATNTGTLTGRTLTIQSGGAISGLTVTVGGVEWGVESVSGSTVSLLPNRFDISTQPAANQIYVPYRKFPSSYVGATVRIFGTVLTITAIGAPDGDDLQLITFNASIPTINDDTAPQIESVPNTGTVNVNDNRFHAIDAYKQFVARDLYIVNFNGNGLDLDSNKGANTNLSEFQEVYITYCKGAGVYATGNDANAIKFNGLNIQGCYYGIWGSPFLGNIWKGLHLAANRAGSWIGGNQNEVSGYTESDQPATIVSPGNKWSGVTNDGAGFASAYPNTTIEAGGVIEDFSGKISYTKFASPKQNGNPRFLQEFKSHPLASTANWFNRFGLRSDEMFHWSAPDATLSPDTLALIWRRDIADPVNYPDTIPYYLSTYYSNESGGALVFPYRFYGGFGATSRQWRFVSSIPTSGIVQRSDIFWNNGAGAGVTSPRYWFATQSGQLGTVTNQDFTVNAATNRLVKSNHGLLDRQIVRFIVNTNGVTAGQDYFVRVYNNDEIYLGTTLQNAMIGSYVDLTGTGLLSVQPVAGAIIPVGGNAPIAPGDVISKGVTIGASGDSYGDVGYNYKHTETSGVYKAIASDRASQIYFYDGGFYFKTAPNPGAGNEISLSDLFRIMNNGTVYILDSGSLKQLKFDTASGGKKFLYVDA